MEVEASVGMGEPVEAALDEQVVERNGEKQEAKEQEQTLEEDRKGENGHQEGEQVVVEGEPGTTTVGEASGNGGGEAMEGEVVASSPAAPPTPVMQNAHQSHHHVAAGPRPAPAYRVVDSIMEKRDDGPGPRCGHTLTAVSAVNEEGSPGYIGPRLILFGGATALEGSSAAGPQVVSPGAGIRTYLFLLSSL